MVALAFTMVGEKGLFKDKEWSQRKDWVNNGLRLRDQFLICMKSVVGIGNLPKLHQNMHRINPNLECIPTDHLDTRICID